MASNVYSLALKRRRGRNAIPNINPNPRPPNERGFSGQGQDNQALGVAKAWQRNKDKKKPGKPNKPGKLNKGDIAIGGATATQPSMADNGQGAGMPYAAPTDPRDSQYWRDLAVLMQNKSFGLQELDIEGQYAKTAYESNVSELNKQQPREELGYKEGANRGGAFYSSRTTEGLGQIAQNYFNQKSTLARDFNREESLRSLMRDMINSGYTAEQAALYAESVDRASEGELNRPAPPTNAINTALEQRMGRGKRKGKNKGKNKKK